MGSALLYILFTTGRCNLRCRYCGGSIPPDKVSWEVKYEIDELRKFMDGDDERVIAFYGGEPLLNHEFVMRVMDSIPAEHFVIQTNGTLVKLLPPKYWMMFDAVLLSVDGRREVTDYYRGRGAYEAAIGAAKYLRKIGFNGDLIARMTVSEESDVYEEVTHLLSLGLFDHVHWQLDVIWSDRWSDFERWAEEDYKSGINRLIGLWISSLRMGKVAGIAPFLGVLRAALERPNEAPPCGAGRDSLSILPDGKVIACPIAFDVSWSLLGDLRSGRGVDLARSLAIGEPCVSCEYFRYCGGRCLYAYKERLWGDEGFERVCNVTKHMIDGILRALPEVKELIGRGKVSPDQLVYPRFNNTIEIIP